MASICGNCFGTKGDSPVCPYCGYNEVADHERFPTALPCGIDSYTESWVSENGDELPLKDSNNNVASIINFNSGWTKDSDGYYYYGSKSSLTRLESGNTSTSFISGVTFNPNIQAILRKTTSADGKTITYSSDGNGYDGATYTLTITMETIQYDQASSVWN